MLPASVIGLRSVILKIWLKAMLFLALLFTGAIAIASTATSTAVSASANAVSVGQGFTLTATVTGSNPTGTIAFEDSSDNATLGTVDVLNGVVSLSTSLPSAGTHIIYAYYYGDANNSSSASSTITITASSSAATTVYLDIPSVVSLGETASLYLYGTNAQSDGIVTFKDGATTLGTATFNIYQKFATFNMLATSAGTHTITAIFAGVGTDTTDVSTSASLLVTPITASNTLTISASSISTGQGVTLTSTVTGNSPTGTVTFMDGTTALATGSLTAGVATYVVTLPLFSVSLSRSC